MTAFYESELEEAALLWLQGFGYAVHSGLDIAPGELLAERENYSQVILERRLRIRCGLSILLYRLMLWESLAQASPS